jgi:hypothetical protein
MNIRIFDRFGSGILVLAMLTVAVVASQAELNDREPAGTENAFERGADIRIAIGHERLRKLQSLSSAVKTVMELPIQIEFVDSESEAPLLDKIDPIP